MLYKYYFSILTLKMDIVSLAFYFYFSIIIKKLAWGNFMSFIMPAVMNNWCSVAAAAEPLSIINFWRAVLVIHLFYT